MPRKRILLPLLAAAAALLAAACSGGDVSNDEFSQLETQVAALQTELATVSEQLSDAQESAQRALMVASLPAFDTPTFHAIDEQINNEQLIHQTTPGIVERALVTLQQPIWPEELAPNVEQYRNALAALLELVLDDDAEAAGRPATIAHALTHAFDSAVSAYLSGEAVPPPPDLGDDEPPEEEHDE